MINITMLSDDPQDREIARRYWATDEQGNFMETVSDLLPYKEMTHAHQLIAFLGEVAIATDSNQLCSQCDEHFTVTSRRKSSPKGPRLGGICVDCRTSNADQARRLAEAERHELQLRLEQREQHNLTRTANYGSIPFDLVLLLIAVDRASSPKLARGTFSEKDCSSLVHWGKEKFIRTLLSWGLIVDIPSKASPGTYLLKHSEINYYPAKLAYSLVPDELYGKSELALAILSEREPQDGPAVYMLWLDYATADCIGYLHDQCELHRLELSDDAETQITSTIRSALPRYSPSQIWSILWKVVRDAASLSTREYYNKQKAADTIPGKIKRNLEHVERTDLHIKDWSRPQHQPAGTLGDLFYDYFGITESTPSQEVAARIYAMCPTAEAPDRRQDIEQTSRTMMAGCLSNNISGEVLQSFAGHIRAGKSTERSLAALFVEYPALASVPIGSNELADTDW